MQNIELPSNIFTKILVQCRRWTSVVCDRLCGRLGDESAV